MFTKEELLQIQSDIYLILGDKDQLFPFAKTVALAKKYLQSLGDVIVLANTGHGIETKKEAFEAVLKIFGEE